MDETRRKIQDQIEAGDRKQLLREFLAVNGRMTDELEDVSAEKQRLQRENDDLRRQLAEAHGETSQGKPLVVFISGAPGMDVGLPPYSGAESPLEAALEATLKLPESGVNTLAYFWGDGVLSAPLGIKAGADINTLLERAPVTGTDFAPVVTFMDFSDPSHPDNFVIISDGSLPEQQGLKEKISAALHWNPKMTLDFVVMSQMGSVTDVERLADYLRETAGDRVTVRALLRYGEAPETLKALKSIAADRTGQPEKPQAPRRERSQQEKDWANIRAGRCTY